MEKLIAEHQRVFHAQPEIIVAAPGRVNLIGEHTDYNDGFVFPMAIGQSVWVAASRRKDQQLGMASLDFGQHRQAALGKIQFQKEAGWANYPMGIVSVLKKHGFSLDGVNLTISGDVPKGSGLSSSAAIEVATAFALQSLFGFTCTAEELARLAQETENSFVGVKCGIMDQFISRLGKEGHALLLDCRSLQYRYVPLVLGDAQVLITNTNVPRKLVDSEYNLRRMQCQQCVAALQRHKPGKSLRDYTAADIHNLKKSVSETVRRRGLHVVEENRRVLQAEEALQKNDLAAFGELMNQSHHSLRDLYEVSCAQLDWLAERAREIPGVYGSRMTGAGFGGCTVTLIDSEAIPMYRKKIEPYFHEFGIQPEITLSQPSPGARVVWRRP